VRQKLKCILMVALAVSIYAVIRETAWRLAVGDIADARPIPTLRKQRIALHEAGHAVVYATLRGPAGLRSLSVCSVYGLGENLGEMNSDDNDVDMMTLFEGLQRASYMLAGQAANVSLGDGPTNGASDDIKRASKLVWSMHGQFGMGRTMSYYEGPLEAPPQVETMVETDLQLAYACAQLVINHNRVAMKALSDLLLATPPVAGKHMLGTARLAAFFKAHPVSVPDHPDLPWFCDPEPFGAK